MVLVASNTAEDDVVFLSTLESVYARDFDLLVKLLLQGTMGLHGGHNIGTLALIRSDDTNLTWQNTRFEETRDNFLNVGSLGSALT